MKAAGALILLTILIGLAGCNDTSPAEPGDTDTGRTGTSYDEAIAQVSVAWHDCSDNWTDGECSSTVVPLFWGSSRDDQIAIAALRKADRSEGFAAQLWFVDGGPGSPGTANLDWLLDLFLFVNPELELFTLDHRGTGASHYLGCDGYEYGNFVGTCVPLVESTYGDRLEAFSTTNAAIDLAALIEANRREDVPVFVMGLSYGTYLAQRFLQIFPDWVDGVILDGIAAPESTFLDQNAHVDQVATELFERCAADSFCSEKLGPNPFARMASALEMVDQGHCSEIGTAIDGEFLGAIAVEMLYGRPLNEMLPALFYRLERCSPEDVAVWQSVIDGMGYGSWLDDPLQAPLEVIGGFSRVLYANVVLSELWEHPRWSSPDEMQAFLTATDENAVLRFTGQQELFDGWLVWPTYSDTTYDNKWAETDIPLLMLQGELDPATPWEEARPVGDWFDGPSQYFVSFPDAAHGTVVGTPRVDGYPDCAFKMVIDFVEDPLSAPNRTCIERIYPLDFSGDAYAHDYLTGTDDLWGDQEIAPAILGATAHTTSARRSSEEIERAIAEAQRRRQFRSIR